MPKYTIVIEKTDHNYSAYCPDLSGCVATGRTEEEVFARMREAIEFHIQGLRESKFPVPESKCSVRELEIPA